MPKAIYLGRTDPNYRKASLLKISTIIFYALLKSKVLKTKSKIKKSKFKNFQEGRGCWNLNFTGTKSFIKFSHLLASNLYVLNFILLVLKDNMFLYVNSKLLVILSTKEVILFNIIWGVHCIIP